MKKKLVANVHQQFSFLDMLLVGRIIHFRM